MKAIPKEHDIWNDIENDILSMKSDFKIFNITEIDFKVKNLMIEYKINKDKNNLCDAISNFKESVIENNYLKNVSILLDIKFNDLNDEFIYYIKSVIFHELLHIYQYYNILSNKKFRTESFSIGSVLPQLRKIVNTDYIKYILDVLYYSLSHEISAQIHQYYLYKVNKKDYIRLNNIKNILSKFNVKQLTNEEDKELIFIKEHIKKSIEFYTKNKNYKNNIEKSIWNENDNIVFLNKLKDLFNKKVKWIDKKVKLINNKIDEEKIIRYDQTISLPSNWDEHDINDAKEYQKFIKENLNDCKILEFL